MVLLSWKEKKKKEKSVFLHTTYVSFFFAWGELFRNSNTYIWYCLLRKLDFGFIDTKLTMYWYNFLKSEPTWIKDFGAFMHELPWLYLWVIWKLIFFYPNQVLGWGQHTCFLKWFFLWTTITSWNHDLVPLNHNKSEKKKTNFLCNDGQKLNTKLFSITKKKSGIYFSFCNS